MKTLRTQTNLACSITQIIIKLIKNSTKETRAQKEDPLKPSTKILFLTRTRLNKAILSKTTLEQCQLLTQTKLLREDHRFRGRTLTTRHKAISDLKSMVLIQLNAQLVTVRRHFNRGK